MAPTTTWRIEARRPCRMTPGKLSAPAASHPTRSKPMLTASHASRSDDSVVWRGWSDWMWADLQRHPVGLPPRVRCLSLSPRPALAPSVGERGHQSGRMRQGWASAPAGLPPKFGALPCGEAVNRLRRVGVWPSRVRLLRPLRTPPRRRGCPCLSLPQLDCVAPCASHSLTAGVIKESEKKKVGKHMPKTFLQLTTPPKTHH